MPFATYLVGVGRSLAFCAGLCLLPHLFYLPVAQAGDQVIRIATGADPGSLDPQLISGEEEQIILQELFEGLVSRHPKTLEPIPAIAEKIDISKDGKTYTFRLRKGVKWSNGQPITAEDFVYAWTRLLMPKTGALYASMLYMIRGAQEFNSGDSSDSKTLGIQALSKRRFRVELLQPTPYFLWLIAAPQFAPLHRATVEKHGRQWIHPKHMVSSGPFRLVEHIPNNQITLRQNSHYWDSKAVKLGEVRFITTEKADTAFKMYEAGQLDINRCTLPLRRLGLLKDRSDFFQARYFGFYYYEFNTEQAPYNDPRVRRALSLAIDRKVITKNIFHGLVTPGRSMIPPGLKKHKPLAVEGFRPEKAKQLLSEAGFCTQQTQDLNCKPFPKIRVAITNQDVHRQVALSIRDMWKNHLGIQDVVIENREWKMDIARRKAKKYDVGFRIWRGDYLDPYTFLEIWSQQSENNLSGWKNDAYEGWLNKANREANLRKRRKYLHEAEKVLAESIPAIPIYGVHRMYLVRPGVKGIYPNLFSLNPLKYVSIAKP